MQVICFGDSNTYGYDPRSYLGGRYGPRGRWVDLLAAETGWTVRNWGANGREIPEAAPDFPADTDLLVVMLGTNDLLQGRGPEAAAGRLAQLLTGAGLPRDRLLLIAPPPLARGPGFRTRPSSTHPGPLPGAAGPWRSGWASPLPTPGHGASPWPMTAYTSRSRATGPLRPAF